MDREYIKTETKGNILIVDIKANAFNSEVFKELNDVLDNLGNAKGLVLTSVSYTNQTLPTTPYE